ncbi:CBS domain-containing protein [Hymenobacter sp. NBH84]|uniref:CBS domain-containing protein n=1 Tax=Hymenobacter sp. NBH84 TaxID=2596915 RepID=UPI0016236EA3|nr:CBS domain-containing protein [Hymenobacter sp. NBH84]
MPIPAGQLVKNQQLLSVSLGTTLDQALKLMIKHEFSQLPVIDKDKKPLGIVTGDSIARALLRFSGASIDDLQVNDAIIKLPTITVDEDLLYIIDNLLKASAVLLIDGNGTLVNILTAYDTTQYFRKRAEDIVLLEDIENTLKSHIKLAYTPEELQDAINGLGGSWDDVRKRGDNSVKALCKENNIELTQDEITAKVDKFFPPRTKKDRDLDDLTLEEFIQLAEKEWPKFEQVFGVGKRKKDAWSKMMREVRNTRNDIFHFRGEVSAEDRHSLRFCADWYAIHQPSQNEANTQQEEPIPVEAESVPVPSEAEMLAYSNVDSLTQTLINKIFSPIKVAYSSDIKTNISIENKYIPFVKFLTEDIKEQTNIIDTTIDAIEKLIKQPLPRAAREHSSWWLDYSSQSREWLLAGWRVESVNLSLQRIRFYRWSYLINVDDPEQVTKWCSKLGCTEQELRKVITYLGRNLSTEVEYYLNLQTTQIN